MNLKVDPNDKTQFPDPGPLWDVSKNIPDLTGKVAVVTGANSRGGIGYHIAHQLAINGARVYVSARSIEKAESGIAEMKQDTPTLLDGQLQPLAMDLSEPKQALAAAETILAKETRLDIIINNAAKLAGPYSENSYGISETCTVNHLSPFIFTTKLLPLLKETSQKYPGVRVINVSSAANTFIPADINIGSIEKYGELFADMDDNSSDKYMMHFGLSKLANVLFIKQLQYVFDKQGIEGVALSTNPGIVRTDGSLEVIKTVPFLHDAVHAGMPPLHGALTELFAATNPDVWIEKDKYAGAYLVPYGEIGPTTAAAQSKELAQQLWVASERVAKKMLAS